MTKVKIIVTGIPEIDRRLRTLPYRVQRKVVMQSMRKGMKIVLSEAKKQVPVDSGLTKANIKLRVFKFRKRDEQGLQVSVMSNPGFIRVTKAGIRYWYPAIVEFGAKNRKANPFLRRTYTSMGPMARNIAMIALRDGVIREAGW
jgi:HK97 gp10 family phage protein